MKIHENDRKIVRIKRIILAFHESMSICTIVQGKKEKHFEFANLHINARMQNELHCITSALLHIALWFSVFLRVQKLETGKHELSGIGYYI